VNWNLLFGPRIAASIHPHAPARYDEIIFNRNSSIAQSQVAVSPVIEHLAHSTETPYFYAAGEVLIKPTASVTIEMARITAPA